jgi:hypothetical protein
MGDLPRQYGIGHSNTVNRDGTTAAGGSSNSNGVVVANKGGSMFGGAVGSVLLLVLVVGVVGAGIQKGIIDKVCANIYVSFCLLVPDWVSLLLFLLVFLLIRIWWCMG